MKYKYYKSTIDFKDKVILITGGTGSFGKAVLNKFLKTNIEEIRVFSRDEKKQDDLRKKYNNSKIKFYLGDIRDKNSIEYAIENVDFIFHAAAYKHVGIVEENYVSGFSNNIIITEALN